MCKGAPGGVEIVKGVEVSHWISAHDGEKEVKGWATKWTKQRKYEVGEVVRMLEGGKGKEGRGKETEVCVVECGETRRFV